MPGGVVQMIRDRVGGSAVSGVSAASPGRELVGHLVWWRGGPFACPREHGGVRAGTGAPAPHARSAGPRRAERGRAGGALEPVRKVLTRPVETVAGADTEAHDHADERAPQVGAYGYTGKKKP